MLRQIAQFTNEELRFGVASYKHRITQGKRCAARTVLVNGSPKTGTTWMFKLIASIPGYQHVGNFNRDIQRYWNVHPGDVIHGHDPYSNELWSILQAKNIGVVLMIRDPRDQTVSRMFHIRRDETHRWHRQMSEMVDEEALLACIEGRAGLPGTSDMMKLTRSWIDAGDKACCVRYEDLSADPTGELRRVLQYLEIDVAEGLLRAIVARNRFERLSVGRRIWQAAREPGQQRADSHFRKGIVGDWKNYFQPIHHQKFKEVAGELLISLGYETDLNW